MTADQHEPRYNAFVCRNMSLLSFTASTIAESRHGQDHGSSWLSSVSLLLRPLPSFRLLQRGDPALASFSLALANPMHRTARKRFRPCKSQRHLRGSRPAWPTALD